MRPLYRDPILILGAVIFILGSAIMIVPHLMEPREGSLRINPSSPSGIRAPYMVKGDRIDLRYSSDDELSVYLLTADEANGVRSPSYYKDPLPSPIHTGRKGDIAIEIEEKGDYEILLWNESWRTVHDVEYTVDIHSSKDIIASLYFGIPISLTGSVMILISLLRRRGKKRIP